MADNEEKPTIQRIKKPRTQKQIDATKKMLEGRKKWAENKGKENKAKKVNKLKEKIAKIDPDALSQSQFQTETLEGDVGLPVEVELEDDTSVDAIEGNISVSMEDMESEENAKIDPDGEATITCDVPKSTPKRGNASKSTPKGLVRQNAVQPKKKKKTIVNNYHYEMDESSSDEEIVNNYYMPKAKKKSKSKKKVKYVEPSSSEDEEEEYYEEIVYPQPPKNVMRFV